MTKHLADFEVNRPGSLIAALPAILGFVPEKSLVLVSLERGALGAVMRADLDEGLVDRVDQLAQVAAAAEPEAAIVVIVDDEGAHCPVCNEEYRRLCEALFDALAKYDIALYAAHVVDEITCGGRWHCVDDCGASGEVEDPSASPLAAAAVLDGRRLYPRRADLQAVVAPDHTRAMALAPAVAKAAKTREKACRDDAAGCCRSDVENALAVADRAMDGQPPTDAEVARLGCALTDTQVRDTLYALAVAETADAAESLWSMLARALPQPWRVEALVLLAFSAYVRGDGPLAGVSLEAALRCDPEHRMAGMLDTALQSGMRPNEIRRLANTGYQLAEQLGVRMPPRQKYRRRAG
ncbi:DUF4192 domain-containing protein [Mycobacterium vicinigordonae]|uniref:DUF4192 domain-containing protein n=1 Tax=Mycobacterium vicinigordonae TaxID=1719132 RepID=A0A7D6E829_9MYCO|nr:DUF4192 domain-containing protein [Mycobacterium vicinigordonae]QLL09362.1 DUF4192 domain-containing protein [Mycobacterium vicinigordonae]